MRVIMTDEMLDFYAEEYLEKKKQGIIKDIDFNNYLNIKLLAMYMDTVKLKGAKK